MVGKLEDYKKHIAYLASDDVINRRPPDKIERTNSMYMSLYNMLNERNKTPTHIPKKPDIKILNEPTPPPINPHLTFKPESSYNPRKDIFMPPDNSHIMKPDMTLFTKDKYKL
ncbi:MAG: hypothetical protein ACLFN8_04880 [Candidatus Woesearchaeota archaeon]